VWGSSKDDIHAVGDRGAVVHFDGKSWTAGRAPTDENLLAISAPPRTRRGAVGWQSKPPLANPSPKRSLPLPAQFLREASDLAAITGTKVRYRLISLWPINPLNAPTSVFETQGLEAIREHPERASTRTVMMEGQRYFQAIYADRAVTQACIGCHNAHPSSPKKDFKIADVMGGLVIEIPLER